MKNIIPAEEQLTIARKILSDLGFVKENSFYGERWCKNGFFEVEIKDNVRRSYFNENYNKPPTQYRLCIKGEETKTVKYDNKAAVESEYNKTMERINCKHKERDLIAENLSVLQSRYPDAVITGSEGRFSVDFFNSSKASFEVSYNLNVYKIDIPADKFDRIRAIIEER